MRDLFESTYQPGRIEQFVQSHWNKNRSFEALEDESRIKYYCLCMFPYPSGRLHMGHVRNYTIGDVISRYKRLQGFNVLQPMGWDAFGLPAENAAIENDTPPAEWTKTNIEYMRAQLKRLGFAYDWNRELSTCDPDYYKWEQWFFNKLYRQGLVYREEAEVNWDPVDQTVLANEQVIDGLGWRSGAPVERKRIPQWFLKITDYADELLESLDKLEGWPDSVKTMQRNWIGRSEGLNVKFSFEEGFDYLEVFTTRPDTLMGVTYLAVAPDHPMAVRIASRNKDVAKFLSQCRETPLAEMDFEKMEKQGVPLGLFVIHPLTRKSLPVWTANFVLMGYGTGAVMAVPAHDQRDWEFATKYELEIRQVIEPIGGEECDLKTGAFVSKGQLVNSGEYDEMGFSEAFAAIGNDLERRHLGKRKVQYRLRDWLVSRQRYWGCPIPVLYSKDGDAIPEADDRLPVVLPEKIEWGGVSSPLVTSVDFKTVTTPDGRSYERETDTFDTFFESSWYFSRFCSAGAQDSMLDDRAKYWMPVDIYIGGVEHAVLHLLYARFFHKAMRDEGLVDSDEPFKRLLTQGMVCKETYYRSDGSKKVYYNPSQVSTVVDSKGKVTSAVLKSDGQPVEIGPVEKMSKSKNNGIDPEELINTYGADTLRLYTMFAAPPDQSLEWSESAVEGAFRFIKTVWRQVYSHVDGGITSKITSNEVLSDELKRFRRQIHETIVKVTDDIDRRYKFNTAIASIMELVNTISRTKIDGQLARQVRQEALEVTLLLLTPITPHVTEVLWRALGHNGDIAEADWPVPDQSALIKFENNIVVQVNGKKRSTIILPTNSERLRYESEALDDANVKRYIEGKKIEKVIVVADKLVNIVAK